MSGMKNPFAENLKRSATLLGRGSAYGLLFDYHGEYPCAVASVSKSDVIQGEIYQLNLTASLLADLDVYEDSYHHEPGRSFFVRCVVPVFRYEDKKEIRAWMYFWNQAVDSLQEIEHGDYRKHCS